MQDLYAVLGVPRSAADDEIKQAFRTLAKRFHPDTPDGAADKGRRFQQLNAAYEILSDQSKRGQYDRGEIDGHGNPRPRKAEGPRTRPDSWTHVNGHGGPMAERRDSGGSRWSFARAFGLGQTPDGRRKKRVEELFSEFFGERQKGAKGAARKGIDSQYELSITFEEAILGGTRRVKMPNGRRFDVKVPIGVKEGQVIRLKGLGESGLAGGIDGDALVTIRIETHPYFRREGRDILLELPVTLAEAICGAKVKVPTLQGPVTMTIPEGTNSGAVFRLKGKGVPGQNLADAGDQLVTVVVHLPEKPNGALTDFVKRWEAQNRYNPRKVLGED